MVSYVFRSLIGLGLLAFMAMLYWSSLVVEEKLRDVKAELNEIKRNLSDLKQNGSKGSPFAPTGKSSDSLHAAASFKPVEDQEGNNLLTPDPFYQSTLPKLLGADFKPYGIRNEATIGKPNNLNPFSNWSEIASWIALCSVSIAGQKVGEYETYTPDMAFSMQLRHTPDGKSEYWLRLREDVYWEPLNPAHFPEGVTLAPMFLQRHQVTAHDFKFYYDIILNPHVEEPGAVALRIYLDDIEEMKAVDDFTLVVRWKTKIEAGSNGEKSVKTKYLAKSTTAALRPLPRFVYQYFNDGTKIIVDDSDPNTYRTNPVWAQNFSHHWANNVIVSCGAWLFDGMTDREIRFKRNPDFYAPYASLTDSYEVKFRNTPDAIWEAFKMGSLDLFSVPPNLLAELDNFLASDAYRKQAEQGLEIKRLDYLNRAYTYIGWNETNPLFKNKKVRQALTMAIDRERIIRQNLNGMGVQTTGTFFPYSPSYDTQIKPYPFDPDQAKQLLQEEGWVDTDGDGVLDKEIEGKSTSFRFTLIYYVKNPATKAICEYIATALKQVGIKCIPNGVDLADLSATFEDKNFDAIVLGWALGTPPENPKQIWYSSGAKEKGSSNAVGFSNQEADRIIDQLEFEDDPDKRITLYHQFDKILHEEAPYTFLYVPKATLAYRAYLQNVFIPADRKDLFPDANVGEPQPSIFWISQEKMQ